MKVLRHELICNLSFRNFDRLLSSHIKSLPSDFEWNPMNFLSKNTYSRTSTLFINRGQD